MSFAKYFRIPFADAGDVAAVPDAAQVDGSISYTDGYGPDYQLDPGTDPSALDIERNKMNGLFNAITTALKEGQESFVPPWISPAINGGVAFSYPAMALVRYDGDGQVYQSLVNANVWEPSTAPTKWIAFQSNLATAQALANEIIRATAAEALLLPLASLTAVLGNPGALALPVQVGGIARTFLLKWGSRVLATGNGDAVAFAAAFPNACFGVLATNISSGDSYVTYNGLTAAAFNAWILDRHHSQNPSPGSIFYAAIGW